MAILLIGVTINRIVFGLSLIVAFSMGLAAVLIAIGVLIVQGRRLFERLQWFDRISYAVPIVSAGIVLGVGTILTIAAFQNFPGTPIQVENQNATTVSPSFDMQKANVIYLATGENNQIQLFIIPASGGDPQPVNEEGTVLSYSVVPGYSAVIYVTTDGKNGTRLWQWTPATATQEIILECPNVLCSNVVLSPDGSGLLYGRLETDAITNPSGIQSIWWLDLTTRETAPLFQDAHMPGFNPQWSPDGRRLSYTSIYPQEIRIYDIETGESQSISTQTGNPGVWSPNGEKLLLTDIVPVGEYQLSKLFQYDLSSQELTSLDAGQRLMDNYPSWSPDGKWIAVVRGEWDSGTYAFGNQIWLMRSDGTEARPVTQVQNTFHGQPVWSPDGQYLLFDFHFSGSSGVYSGIKILDLETEEVYEIAVPGIRPEWLP